MRYRFSRCRFLTILAVASLSVYALLGQSIAPANGALSGAISAPDATPISGVIVRYTRVPRLIPAGKRAVLAPGETAVSASIASDAAGAFAAPSLPVGFYWVCAEVPSAPYLDPCTWSATPHVTIAGGVTTPLSMTLQKGVYLKVHVNDPLGLLPKFLNGPLRAANLIVGVLVGKGGFHGAANTNLDATGRDFQMVIPTGVPLTLWVFSRDVKLTDSSGRAIPNTGPSIPFQAVPGQDQVFTLNISESVN